MSIPCAQVLLCLLLCVSGKAQQQVTPETLKADSHYIVQDSILIKTRDGVYVSALVVRKAAITAPQPAILQFTIYARAADINKAKLAADKGYVGVMAYTRGKWLSAVEEVIPYEYDGRDAYDVIDWISRQPWCNGKVGMMGGSYNGFTQWAATKRMHPALKTIVPAASVAPGLDVPMMNNVFMTFPFSWTYYVSNNKFLDEADYRGPHWLEVQQKWFQLGATYPSLDSILGRPHNKIFRTWLAHPTYDRYWQQMIPYQQEFSTIHIPVLTTTGYYDGAQVGALYYFREHYKYHPKADHYLLIGPYGHFGAQALPDSVYAGYRIDPVANISILDIVYQWFDHILKGAAKPALLKDKINYAVMGNNRWRHAAGLKSITNDTLTCYLHNKQGGVLTNKKPRNSGYSSLQIDLADRTTTNSYYFMNNIIYDSLFAGGGLMFTSEPLREAIEFTGNFTGEMKVTINKKDLDYSVVLFERMPDGRYFYLSYFMGRASYAKDNTTRKLLVPGRKTTIPFGNSYFTSKKLSKGSRLVIIVNVNKDPFGQINYGTGKEVNEETIKDAGQPLQIKWHNDSFIKVPVWR
jgi:uncharacterized protein